MIKKTLATLILMGLSILTMAQTKDYIELPSFVKHQFDEKTLSQTNTFCFDNDSNEFLLTSKEIEKIGYCITYQVDSDNDRGDYLLLFFNKVFPDKKLIKKYTKYQDYWIEETYDSSKIIFDTLFVETELIIIDSAKYFLPNPYSGELRWANHKYYNLKRKY